MTRDPEHEVIEECFAIAQKCSDLAESVHRLWREARTSDSQNFYRRAYHQLAGLEADLQNQARRLYPAGPSQTN